ncbi:MAG: alpha-ketoacid dehydrogenase subunit beta [Candidatus Iainarchaeum archaeon]|uniref:3-methyl-2-oxobutanoate dehydrogenase (2-methylpropanoyl-transferring) n=1 Tax=Candidatus Iainarchaeum sp. TaxID=3101447 RepID=A0A7T9I1E7_9ARCH|nr:MAG: alpha-ketoacid dehydrogenase subunit beta [Candidatus Diapherotrites archaeon]
MTKMNMVQALNSALMLEMESNKDVVVLGEDVGVDGGVFRVTEGLQSKYGKQRVIDTPLAESGIIGTSIGMAIYGLKPVAEVQFSGFIYPAFNQIVSHAARIRNRTRGKYASGIVVRTPCSGGVKALEHHSESTEAFFIHTPGLKVVMPASPYDAKGLLAAAIRDPDPVIFFEPLKLYRAYKEEVPEEAYTIPLGKAKVVQEGSDVTLIAWGSMVKTCQEALQLNAQNEKYSIELIDLRTLSPLDWPAVHKSVQKTGRCVIVQEAPKTLGLGAEIAARLAEEDLLSLKSPIVRVTGFDTMMPYFKLENYYIPSPERVLHGVKKAMQF